VGEVGGKNSKNSQNRDNLLLHLFFEKNDIVDEETTIEMSDEDEPLFKIASGTAKYTFVDVHGTYQE
jgi:hypothetical protein